MSTISEHITKLLKDRNLKPADLSRGTGINQPAISKIINKEQMPTVDTLYKIATFFNTSMEYLYTGSFQQEYLTERQKEMLDMINSLNLSEQEEIIMLMKYKLSHKEHMGEYSPSENRKKSLA